MPRGRPPKLLKEAEDAYSSASWLPMWKMIGLLKAADVSITDIHRHLEAITGMTLTRSCVRKWIEKFK